MDIYSLAITYIDVAPRPTGPSAEDSYYAKHTSAPRFRPVLLGPVIIAAGVIMVFGVTLI